MHFADRTTQDLEFREFGGMSEFLHLSRNQISFKIERMLVQQNGENIIRRFVFTTVGVQKRHNQNLQSSDKQP